MTSAGSNAIRVPSPCTTRTCGVCAKFAVARAASSASYSIAVTLPVAPTSSARICRVIADADADMQDMLPWLGRGGGNQRRMKRGLAVVQVALRQDADHVVGVQVNRVGIRRRTITAAPAHDVPAPGPRKSSRATAAK